MWVALSIASSFEVRADTALEDPTKRDSVTGKEVFARCSVCHSLIPGRHGIGPSLAGVLGRKAGTAAGYGYSPAMKASNVWWTEETLDAHLEDVTGFIPGNRMGALFPRGVPSAAERAAVIAYLKAAGAE